MLHTALDFLAKEMNAYLEVRNGMVGDKVVLTNVATENGGWAIPNDHIGLSLINIEEERVFKEQRTAFKNENGQTEHYNPEVKLNLYVLVTANFSNAEGANGAEVGEDYKEGLKQLSYIISFFQGKNVFTNDNSPLLAETDPTIQKMVIELYSYSFEQLYNFWTVVGAKYLPSILYRIRLIKFQEKRSLESPRGLITTIDIEC